MKIHLVSAARHHFLPTYDCYRKPASFGAHLRLEFHEPLGSCYVVLIVLSSHVDCAQQRGQARQPG